MQLVDCSLERHGAQILELFNHEIRNSTALYEYQERSLATLEAWFAAKRAGNFPVLGVEAEGQLLGFGSYGPFRNFPAFKYSAEHSVYVHHAARRRGVGQQLLHGLVQRAEQQQLHALIGAIDSANSGSIALHVASGFQHVGTLPQVGFKFGRWLDLALYQRVLSTPHNPSDGE